jgi:hypothetical protein
VGTFGTKLMEGKIKERRQRTFIKGLKFEKKKRKK